MAYKIFYGIIIEKFKRKFCMIFEFYAESDVNLYDLNE
jgi:hypothetical protein